MNESIAMLYYSMYNIIYTSVYSYIGGHTDVFQALLVSTRVPVDVDRLCSPVADSLASQPCSAHYYLAVRRAHTFVSIHECTMYNFPRDETEQVFLDRADRCYRSHRAADRFLLSV